MNKFIGIGRTTKDIELSQTPNGISVAKFTLAVPRKFKNAQGEKETDFLNCVAWRKSAEIINQYVKKGDQLAVTGSVQTRSYEKDGTRRYITEIIVEEFEFLGGRKVEEKAKMVEIEPQLPDELPF